MSDRDYNGATVLVADDEECLLKLTEIVLSQEGYNVLTAGNAAEALEIADLYAGQIDLLLTDMCMPDMDGTKLSLEFKKTYPDSKVIYMTAFSCHEVEQRLAGATVVSKPFCLDGLCNVISESLSQCA